MSQPPPDPHDSSDLEDDKKPEPVTPNAVAVCANFQLIRFVIDE